MVTYTYTDFSGTK